MLKLIAGSVIGACLLLGGCERAPGASATPGSTSERQEAISEPVSAGVIPVEVDRATGCQYLGYTGHGLTPRMYYNTTGQYAQMGCNR